MNRKINDFGPYAALILLFVAAVFFRPLLPIDETRYLTVAWEMFLNKNYSLLSLNFSPYHHKPPMLFWLINGVWNIFGVSRWSALIPVFFASSLVLFLTRALARRLFPQHPEAVRLSSWLLLGSIPFLIYSTLMMFDLMVCALVLGVLILFWDYADRPSLLRLAVAAILMGLGVLTKGPVMYLYVLWPLLLYSFWKGESMIPPRQFYLVLAVAGVVSLTPVLVWLFCLWHQVDNNFTFWLVWNQTAGRVSGNFSSAHVRPFYFYCMILPILFMPWMFFPSFWKNMRPLFLQRSGRFLVAAGVPVFLSFSMIAGKQPHYLLPLLPLVIVAVSFLLQDSQKHHLRLISLGSVLLVVVGQGIASQTVFVPYDLRPIAAFYKAHTETEWAFVRNYEGEIGFLARVQKPIQNLGNTHQLSEWFTTHPKGFAIVRYGKKELVDQTYDLHFSIPYRGKRIAVVSLKERKAGSALEQ